MTKLTFLFASIFLCAPNLIIAQNEVVDELFEGSYNDIRENAIYIEPNIYSTHGIGIAYEHFIFPEGVFSIPVSFKIGASVLDMNSKYRFWFDNQYNQNDFYATPKSIPASFDISFRFWIIYNEINIGDIYIGMHYRYWNFTEFTIHEGGYFDLGYQRTFRNRLILGFRIGTGGRYPIIFHSFFGGCYSAPFFHSHASVGLLF